MGDQAEGVFLSESPLGSSEKYGLRRPNIGLSQTTAFVLHTPDFITGSGFLVEVMGVGKDGLIKLKESKYRALNDWNKKQPLMFFVWNSSKQQWMLCTWDIIKKMVTRVRRRGDTTSFENDGNVYHPIPWDEVTQESGVQVAEA